MLAEIHLGQHFAFSGIAGESRPQRARIATLVFGYVRAGQSVWSSGSRQAKRPIQDTPTMRFLLQIISRTQVADFDKRSPTRLPSR
ncbi:hypothetical protein AB4Z54_71835, partial [Streptomyces sp. MCAF7]